MNCQKVRRKMCLFLVIFLVNLILPRFLSNTRLSISIIDKNCIDVKAREEFICCLFAWFCWGVVLDSVVLTCCSCSLHTDVVMMEFWVFAATDSLSRAQQNIPNIFIMISTEARWWFHSRWGKVPRKCILLRKYFLPAESPLIQFYSWFQSISFSKPIRLHPKLEVICSNCRNLCHPQHSNQNIDELWTIRKKYNLEKRKLRSIFI